MCFWMATGVLKYETDISAKPAKYIFWGLFLVHIRLVHFYCIHRVMHPWRIEGVKDFGKLLYKHVHSLHHKSYNCTSFSGTSMHPVESTAYYSALALAWPFSCNPIVPLAILIDCAVGAWLGHTGFAFPGTGDIFH